MIVEDRDIANAIVQPTPTGSSNRDEIGALITGADYRDWVWCEVWAVAEFRSAC